MVMVASGWHTHLGVLIDHLNGEKTPGFWDNFKRLERNTARLSSNRTVSVCLHNAEADTVPASAAINWVEIAVPKL